MKRKIKNPYPSEDFKCFACSPSNPIGLKLSFEEDEEYVYARWMPGENFQGYNNVIHGGIIATLLDEVGAWYISVKLGTAGVTRTLDVEYLKPLYLSRGEVTLRSRLVDSDERNAKLECELFDSSATLCSRSRSVFFLYPEDIARKKFQYPGKEAF